MKRRTARTAFAAPLLVNEHLGASPGTRAGPAPMRGRVPHGTTRKISVETEEYI
jgi:hypothetical protein